MNPLSVLAAVIVIAGITSVMRGRISPTVDEAPCDPYLDDLCAEQGFEEGAGVGIQSRMAAEPTGPVVRASDVCSGAGYLCSELETQERITIRHWKDFSGTLVVYVPVPTFENRADGRALQRAAVQGIRLWNGQPFPISVVERPGRDPHFSVRWSQSLAGTQIGVARTQWSPARGLEVISLELATRSPYRSGSVIDPLQIRLTAMHEMGHALGLPHSDSERDVMYPTSTATALSARDYRTMQALYEMEDGTQIVR